MKEATIRNIPLKLLMQNYLKSLKLLGRSRYLALLLTILSFLSIIATYFSITLSDAATGPNPHLVVALILSDLVLLLTLMGIVAKRVVRLVAERRKGSVGSKLQTKIVVMFSLIAIIPAIVMGVFSASFFTFSVHSWFNNRVSTAVENSVAVAELYLQENKNVIKADILGMARDLNKQFFLTKKMPNNNLLSLLAGVRKVPEALVFERDNLRNVIVARTRLSFSLEFSMDELTAKDFHDAEDGEPLIVTDDNDDKVIALIKLDNFFDDTYLLVGRLVDNKIINHIETTKGAASEYSRLKSDVSSVQIRYFIVFVIISILLLLIVVWYGMSFAMRLVDPISELVFATRKIKKGDLSTRVAESDDNDEITTLAKAFNSMTKQLEKQRKDLISAQRTAAWSDVARRIAHEIKNPLTPIHLAAERLKKKYSNQVSDTESFNKYVETIIRHAGDIGKIIEEFANFARMPAPQFAKHDLTQIVKDEIFARDGISNVEYIFDEATKSAIIDCDASQITQIITNLLKNAEESIQERILSDTSFNVGKITIGLEQAENEIILTITDNGRGIPKELEERLTEPYITSKPKGTGLGLAIVKKIIEEHGGLLDISNMKNGRGVRVTVTFPINNL